MNHYYFTIYLLSVLLSDKFQCNSRAAKADGYNKWVSSENYATLSQMDDSTLRWVISIHLEKIKISKRRKEGKKAE